MFKCKFRILSLVLTVLMLVSMCAIATTASVSAASGDTVYCQDDAGWGAVYCYMWKDGSGDNAGWPGVKMTQGENNLWSYKVTGDWDMIIFNIGSDQNKTQNLNYKGNGSIYNTKTGVYSEGSGTVVTPTNPDTPVTTDTPTVTPAPTGKNVVYCQNDAGWSKVNVYMWNDSGNIKGWPGEAATDMGGGLWMYEYSGNYPNIIFNDGSTQTGDLVLPATGYCYNNKTCDWSIQDSSILHIKSFTADPVSPQYTGVEIALSMQAGGGEGDLSYKFSVKSGSTTTVLSDFSPATSVSWTPTVAGNYTVYFTVKDENGETVEKSMTYTVKDITAEIKPVIQVVGVTPTNSDNNEIIKGQAANINITAGGGNTGTKLLFYKVKITDPSGNTVNVPYYTLSNEYKFTPTVLGAYTITVSVQGSDNTTVTKTVKYESVNELSAPGELKASASISGTQQVGSKVTVSASATGGTAPYTYQFSVNGQTVKAYSSANTYELALSSEGTYSVVVSVKDNTGKVVTVTKTVTATSAENPPIDPGAYLKGDANCDGVVNIKDATAIQKSLVDLITLTSQGEKNAEVDGNDQLNIKDATMIQKHIAGMDVNW